MQVVYFSCFFKKTANPTWGLPVVLGVHCRECAGQEAGPGGRRGAQGQVRAPETLLGPFQAGTARIMHMWGDLPGPPKGLSGPEYKFGFRTAKPQTRALSGAFGSKLTWEMCWFWVLGGGLHLFQKRPLLRGASRARSESRLVQLCDEG